MEASSTVGRLTLAEVARLAHARATPPATSIDITDVELDSTKVHPGALFAALPGHVRHGAQFAAQAQAAGAAAILTDESGAAIMGPLQIPVLVCARPRQRLASIASALFGHPSGELTMLGVTGTNGKTTVTYMVAAALAAAGRIPGIIGTTGTMIGGTFSPASRTTPEAPDLHRLLRQMRVEGVDAVAMEVSSHAIAEHRVDVIDFDVAGFTNLSQDHLDYHHSMEEYFAAKAELFTQSMSAHAVIGIDDQWGVRLAALAQIPLTTWSISDDRADVVVRRQAGHVEVIAGDQLGRLALTLPGEFNLANAACAIGMTQAVGIPLATTLDALTDVVIPGRMQSVAPDHPIRVLVDYAHTPDAVERALMAARGSGRLIAIVGAGGDRDPGKRPLMGKAAARLADVVFVTDDNPRSEVPASIRATIIEGANEVPAAQRAHIAEVADREQAIAEAITGARPGDTVIILGKGHEQGQDYQGHVRPFDDVVTARQQLLIRDSNG